MLRTCWVHTLSNGVWRHLCQWQCSMQTVTETQVVATRAQVTYQVALGPVTW